MAHESKRMGRKIWPLLKLQSNPACHSSLRQSYTHTQPAHTLCWPSPTLTRPHTLQERAPHTLLANLCSILPNHDISVFVFLVEPIVQ